MKEETCMLQDEINQKEKGCLQVAARSASRTFCSAKPAGGLRHMQITTYPFNFMIVPLKSPGDYKIRMNLL